MQILTTSGTRIINFIPRETITGSKTYKLVIKSEAQNKVLFTDVNATFSELDYYYQYSTTQALVENNYYTITRYCVDILLLTYINKTNEPR